MHACTYCQCQCFCYQCKGKIDRAGLQHQKLQTCKIILVSNNSETCVYILSGQKLVQKCQIRSVLASFWQLVELAVCGQTVLPDRSVLIGQKLVENTKIETFKWDILSWLMFI